MTPPKPLEALIERLRRAAATRREGDLNDGPALLMLEAADYLVHLSAGATPAAQDTKPLEALERISIDRYRSEFRAGRDADLALLRAALVRAEESERDEARAARDALMLEYCPEAMTPEQRAEWERSQRAAPGQQSGSGEEG